MRNEQPTLRDVYSAGSSIGSHSSRDSVHSDRCLLPDEVLTLRDRFRLSLGVDREQWGKHLVREPRLVLTAVRSHRPAGMIKNTVFMTASKIGRASCRGRVCM